MASTLAREAVYVLSEFIVTETNEYAVLKSLYRLSSPFLQNKDFKFINFFILPWKEPVKVLNDGATELVILFFGNEHVEFWWVGNLVF